MTTELFETEKYTFAISYDASDRDLNVHRIDAKTLGKSIESMAILIEKADKIIHGNSNSMHLYVSTPAQPGSLIVEFILEVLNPINEPPRVSRRPNFLREYPNEKYLLT
ncbi:hypothetical protein ADP71_14890 [Vitreoscilla sp. C1]|uniref:hypothetical protein n=1 Tax=Vitreoscilla sp. (strain C1) TaxID=96942 RepID=UPI000CDBE20F|nr:hypothetical protein [Vitreoscilla sp. C1]AUZ05085.1 hypothetical protein ADP71_14890 [Vitreoscilla sp. C1]